MSFLLSNLIIVQLVGLEFMAQKRMFDRALIDTDRFMDMPLSTKALYFLLGMEADDEGFVSYKKVIRIHGGTDDEIKVLIAKNFIIKFESGVVVITDWCKNNWLDNRRIKPTEYTTEKKLLAINSKKEYSLSGGLATASLEEYRVEENSIEESSIEELNTTTSVVEAKPKTFGNSLINKMTTELLKATGLASLDGGVAKNRQYANHVAKKIKAEFIARRGNDPTEDEIVNSLIAIISKADTYTRNKLTNFQYLYYNFGSLILQNVNKKSGITILK